jgi:hypothetical protein
MKILESKNMRLSMENNKLNEAVRQTQEVISEQVVRQDRKERVEKAKKVEGRGASDTDRQRRKEVILGEHTESGEPVAETHKATDDVEQLAERVFEDWKHLSGLGTEQE